MIGRCHAEGVDPPVDHPWAAACNLAVATGMRLADVLDMDGEEFGAMAAYVSGWNRGSAVVARGR